MGKSIYDVFDIDMSVPANMKPVVKMVCAVLNSKKTDIHEFELIFNILKTTTASVFGQSYRYVEEHLFFCKNISDFIKREGSCDSPQLHLFIKRSPFLCTLRNYLYIPDASSVFEAPFDKAVTVLMQKGEPGKIPEPVKEGSFKLHEIVKDLRQENDDVQFKKLNKENIGKGLADHLKYISAFANHNGGCIYFGIEDTNSRVVGVKSEGKVEIG